MYRFLIILLALAVMTGCNLKITVLEGGWVVTQSEAYSCAAGNVCVIQITDTFFNETFVAKPAAGYRFVKWKKIKRSFCGQKTKPCHLATTAFAGKDALMAFLESNAVMHLQPVFEKISSGGSGGAGAGVCFNEDLAAQGTRVITRYGFQPGSNIVDFDQRVGEPTTFNGKNVRKMISDITSKAPAATAQATLFFTTDFAKKRSTIHGSITQNISPESGLITVKFLPGMLERFDLAVDESYSQEFDVVTEIELPGGFPELPEIPDIPDIPELPGGVDIPLPGQNLTSRSTLRRTTTYRGVETITVPAGTIQVCRFESETEVVLGGYEVEGLEIIWLGVNSGVTIQEGAGDPLTVLVSGTINGQKLED
jgi:hypothetical protein